jgi:hypothetical protein
MKNPICSFILEVTGVHFTETRFSNYWQIDIKLNICILIHVFICFREITLGVLRVKIKNCDIFNNFHKFHI